MTEMAEWSVQFPQTLQPGMDEIDAYVENPLWKELQAFLRDTYGAKPAIQYSRCGLEPGWNVKYRKGGRALCTVYIRSGYVTVMISIGAREEQEAQAALLTCTADTRALYQRTSASKMGRWLMLDVTRPEMLEDVKALLLVRAHPVKKA